MVWSVADARWAAADMNGGGAGFGVGGLSCALVCTANNLQGGGALPEFACVLLLRALFELHVLLERNAVSS